MSMMTFLWTFIWCTIFFFLHICMSVDMTLTNLSTIYVPHVTLKIPGNVWPNVYYTDVTVLRITWYKNWNTWPSGRRAESLFTSISPPLPPHLASFTRAHASNPILACTKRIRPKWTRVCYVLSVENWKYSQGESRGWEDIESNRNLWYYDRRGKASKDTITHLVNEIIIILGNVSEV